MISRIRSISILITNRADALVKDPDISCVFASLQDYVDTLAGQYAQEFCFGNVVTGVNAVHEFTSGSPMRVAYIHHHTRIHEDEEP